MLRAALSILGVIYLASTAVQAQKANRTLIFANVLFRHGARAPSAQFTNASYAEKFPRGLGELSDQGIENSYKLGRFLGVRYVDSGFLNKKLICKEMYFRSVKLSRCLMTAAIVGSAMFEGHGKNLHVPVLTEETNENLLNYDMHSCVREKELLQEICPTYNSFDEHKSWPLFEDFVYNCLNISNPIFDKYPFKTIEAYINQFKNGIALPKVLADNYDTVMKTYTQVGHFITGTGMYHDPRKMRMKFGNLMMALMKNVKNRWSCYKNGKNCAHKLRRFVAYSTQDWILSGVMESLGVLNSTVTYTKYPEYNSMIIIEMYDNGGKPEIKMFYKKDEVITAENEMLDVTKLIRNCPKDQDYCPLEKFVSCCDDYLEYVPGASCLGQNSDVLEEGNSLKRKRRTKRYAGYE
ncbi:unnamed protein product [Caenorhabditis auriculariae]|uniref:Uncharacterized protein n=1 Tax=Caenorhabditis auriculariae TaxID=2777116 RepID=A0A8S1HSF9_9PELO|nr:unnamed protein product [Caenorhabditis auriculariae]